VVFLQLFQRFFHGGFHAVFNAFGGEYLSFCAKAEDPAEKLLAHNGGNGNGKVVFPVGNENAVPAEAVDNGACKVV